MNGSERMPEFPAVEPTLAELLRRVDRVKADLAWYAAACYRNGATPTDGDHAHLRELSTWLDEALNAAEQVAS